MASKNSKGAKPKTETKPAAKVEPKVEPKAAPAPAPAAAPKPSKRERATQVVTFTTLLEQYDDKTFEHGPNKAAAAIRVRQAGVTPAGDVRFKGAVPCRDGKSVQLEYEVETVPSAVASA